MSFKVLTKDSTSEIDYENNDFYATYIRQFITYVLEFSWMVLLLWIVFGD